MLYHYSNIIVHDVNDNITYNDKSNLLLNGNLSMSDEKMKLIIFHENSSWILFKFKIFLLSKINY